MGATGGVPPGRVRRADDTRWTGPAAAAALYTIAAILLTWPLATALATAIPWDLGDPLLNAWIIAWGADHLWRFLCGDFTALAGYWHANIFHPAPYALAYSEHLFPQAVQALPIWALTRNPVLCYNLLFLSTFVLSGLGTYLLVRELTGDARVALVGGFCYAFAPYRIGQYSHLQVLSSQWMPLALYGFKRYFDTGSLRALAGAAAAALTQGLSCGYYLLFFAPLAAGYVVFGFATRRRRLTAVALAQCAVVAAIAAACTWPFVRPYLELRALEFPERPLAEVAAFSADVRSYATTHAAQWVWGSRLRMHPKPEGELFPGLVVVLLAIVAVAGEVRHRWRDARGLEGPGWRMIATRVAMAAAAGALLVVLAIVVTGGISMRVSGVRVRASGLYDAVLRATAATIVLLSVSRRARAAARAWIQTETAWWALVLVGAAVLSCGPALRNGTRVLEEAAPYGWLYHHVPGFDGLRVPARFAMLVALALSVLGALGLHRLTNGSRRAGRWLALTTLLVLAEGGAAPLPLNAGEPPGEYAVPGAELYSEAGRPPAVYEALAAAQPDAVVLELPLGSPPWDVRAVFYSTVHWRRLVNGYSGGFPQRYVASAAALSRIQTDPLPAWSALRASGATLVVLHRAAYLNGGDAPVVQWLENGGAARIGTFGTDVLYRVPR
jgi:hypothetical protein